MSLFLTSLAEFSVFCSCYMTSPLRYLALAGKIQSKYIQSIIRNSNASESNLTVKVVSPWEIETSLLFFKPSSGFFSFQTLHQIQGIHIGVRTPQLLKYHHCCLNKSSPLISPALTRCIEAGLRFCSEGLNCPC